MFETVDLLRTVKILILLKFGTSYINNFSKVRGKMKNNLIYAKPDLTVETLIFIKLQHKL